MPAITRSQTRRGEIYPDTTSSEEDMGYSSSDEEDVDDEYMPTQNPLRLPPFHYTVVCNGIPHASIVSFATDRCLADAQCFLGAMDAFQIPLVVRNNPLFECRNELLTFYISEVDGGTYKRPYKLVHTLKTLHEVFINSVNDEWRANYNQEVANAALASA